MREKLRILLLLSCGVLIILLAGCACELSGQRQRIQNQKLVPNAERQRGNRFLLLVW